MRSPILISVCFLAALFAAGCGGGGGGSSLGLSNVRVVESAKGTSTIDSSGGTVSTTGPDGTFYELTIPPDALDAPTEISVYPATSVSTSGFSGGVVGAFHLEPSGLVFGVPATMKVTLPAGVDPNTLKPFLYTGDGEDVHLDPILKNGQQLTFLIAHFSGGGGGRGTGGPAPGSAEAIARDAIFQHILIQDGLGQPHDAQFIAGVLLDWYVTSIKPKLQAPMAAEMRMPDVFREWKSWQACTTSGMYDAPARIAVPLELAPELAEADGLAAAAIRSVFDTANAESAVAESLERVKVALYWYRHAVIYGVDHLQNMGIESIRQALACEIVIDSQSFPAQISAGGSGTLQIRAGYRFDNGPVHFTNMVASVWVTNTEDPVSPVGMTSNSNGSMSRSFTRHSNSQPMVLDAEVAFADVKLRTVARRDYPRPVLYQRVLVTRAATGGINVDDFVGLYLDEEAEFIDLDGTHSNIPAGLQLYKSDGNYFFALWLKGQDNVWRVVPGIMSNIAVESINDNLITARFREFELGGFMWRDYEIKATCTNEGTLGTTQRIQATITDKRFTEKPPSTASYGRLIDATRQ